MAMSQSKPRHQRGTAGHADESGSTHPPGQVEPTSPCLNVPSEIAMLPAQMEPADRYQARSAAPGRCRRSTSADGAKADDESSWTDQPRPPPRAHNRRHRDCCEGAGKQCGIGHSIAAESPQPPWPTSTWPAPRMADQVKNAEPEVLRASRRNVKRALASTKSFGAISRRGSAQ